MDLERAAARLLTVGFHGKTLGADVAGLIARGAGGVVLFSRNVGAPAETAELVRALKAHAGRSLFVAIDQEGGRVARLREGFTRVPPMRTLGRTGDPGLAREIGHLLGEELGAVGVDLDFAPVLDVDTNPNNPVIGARSFGSDPELVARLGVALAEGLMQAGVAACGKHFPGHGDTSQDSHHELPRLVHERPRLDAIELVPFRAAAAAGVPSMMTAHVVIDALDADVPATMSRAAVGGILRGELGYDGVVFTDDLEMRAIADHYAAEEVARRGLEAGVDAFLCCHDAALAHRLIDALVDLVRSGRVAAARLAEASERVARLAERWARPPLAAPDLAKLDSGAHRAVVARIEEAAEAADAVALE